MPNGLEITLGLFITITNKVLTLYNGINIFFLASLT